MSVSLVLSQNVWIFGQNLQISHFFVGFCGFSGQNLRISVKSVEFTIFCGFCGIPGQNLQILAKIHKIQKVGIMRFRPLIKEVLSFNEGPIIDFFQDHLSFVILNCLIMAHLKTIYKLTSVVFLVKIDGFYENPQFSLKSMDSEKKKFFP